MKFTDLTLDQKKAVIAALTPDIEATAEPGFTGGLRGGEIVEILADESFYGTPLVPGSLARFRETFWDGQVAVRAVIVGDSPRLEHVVLRADGIRKLDTNDDFRVGDFVEITKTETDGYGFLPGTVGRVVSLETTKGFTGDDDLVVLAPNKDGRFSGVREDQGWHLPRSALRKV